MVKNLFRILLFILIFIVLLISFLSIFGVNDNDGGLSDEQNKINTMTRKPELKQHTSSI